MISGLAADLVVLLHLGFIPLVYPAELTRRTQLALGVGVIALNLCIYGLVALRHSGRNGDDA